jgi:uncharacterized protein YjbJ (UPF0337 family)
MNARRGSSQDAFPPHELHWFSSPMEHVPRNAFRRTKIMARDLRSFAVETHPMSSSATPQERDPIMALNQQTLEGNWNEIKGKIHEKWGQLTQDDLQKAKGNVDQLVGVIQRKTGEARDRVEQFLNDLTAGSAGTVGKVTEAVRNYASQAVESADDVAHRASDYVRGGYVQTERMIQQRPMESLFAGFGAGLVAGVVIGLMMRR